VVLTCIGTLGAILLLRGPTPSAPPTISWLGFPSVIDSLSCLDADRCVVVGAEGVDSGGGPPVAFVTTDGGTTWNLSDLPKSLGDATMTAVSCPTTTECLGLDSRGVLLVSSDGGLRWQVQAKRVQGLDTAISAIHSVQCLSPERCLALTGAGALRLTTDAGARWRTVALPTPGFIKFDTGLTEFDCPTASECVSVGSGETPNGGTELTLFSSFDGGGTWQAFHLTTDLLGFPAPAVTCPTAEYCMVVAYKGDLANLVLVASSLAFDGTAWSMGSPSASSRY